ncbi:hypothetical protein [Sphingomonas vulcanisoli]|uniref:hypothetical protein n=1 Tax=Sphingomonas vulcanisoli TaxID=1658060 RepID=UPI001420D610|nr:hypothetical protein [Sphingomonas vulcanisoli]
MKVDRPVEQEGSGEDRGREIGVAQQEQQPPDYPAIVPVSRIGPGEQIKDQHANPVVSRHHGIFVERETAEQAQRQQRPCKGRAHRKDQRGGGTDQEGRDDQHLRMRPERMGTAQQQIPKRGMTLAMQVTQHRPDGVAAEREG